MHTVTWIIEAHDAITPQGMYKKHVWGLSNVFFSHSSAKALYAQMKNPEKVWKTFQLSQYG